jgi:hypothetical protein
MAGPAEPAVVAEPVLAEPVLAEPAVVAPALRGEPLVWFVGCLLLYLGLGADAFYKTDGPDLVRLLDDHLRTGAPLQHPWHVGFLPALLGLRTGLGWLGLHPGYLALGTWFSALGAALGVACLHAAAGRLGLPRRTARTAALCLALNPGTVLFGTVVEFHGPLLGMVGVATWWTAVQVRNPRWWGLLGLGGLGHLAFLVDGQALFLPVWLLSFFLARRWPNGTRRRDLLHAGLAGVVHAACFLLGPRLWPQHYGFWADLAEGFRQEGSIGRPQGLEWTGVIFVQEWLWPLLPLSALVFLAPLRAGLRREFVAFALGAVPFLYLSVRQLVFEPEFGAYLLPMLVPAALLVAQAAGARGCRWLWLLLPLGLWPWCAGGGAHLREQAAYDAQFATAVAKGAGAQPPFVLVGSARELAAAYARLQPEQFLWVRLSAAMPRAAATPAHVQGMVVQLRALLGAGRAVLLTEAALASLDDPRAAMLAEKPSLQVEPNEAYAGPRFAAVLREQFAMTKAADGLLRLVPKP